MNKCGGLIQFLFQAISSQATIEELIISLFELARISETTFGDTEQKNILIQCKSKESLKIISSSLGKGWKQLAFLERHFEYDSISKNAFQWTLDK